MMNLQFVNETEAVISDSLGNGYGDFNLKRGLESDSDSDPDGSKRHDYGGFSGPKSGKKTKGRVKIKMEFIENKLRRYTTFSKRKTGIMKKAYELSTLTGTQVMLLVASETGHVYTFATKKLQPMITSESGKALIQTCLNSPDAMMLSPSQSADQRMNPTGFEETELSYGITDDEGNDEEQTDHTDGMDTQSKSASLPYIPSVSPQLISAETVSPPASTVTLMSATGASTMSISPAPINIMPQPAHTAPPQLQPPPAHMGVPVTPPITQPQQAHMGSPTLSRTLALGGPLGSSQQQVSTLNTGSRPTLSMQLPNGNLTLLQNNVAGGAPIAITPLQQQPQQHPSQQSQPQPQQQPQLLGPQPVTANTAQQPVYRLQTPSGQVITLPHGLAQISTSTPSITSPSVPTLSQSQPQLTQPVAVYSGQGSSSNAVVYQTPQGIMLAAPSMGTTPEGYIINFPQSSAVNMQTDKTPGAAQQQQQYITIPVPVSLAPSGTPQMLQPIIAQASHTADPKLGMKGQK